MISIVKYHKISGMTNCIICEFQKKYTMIFSLKIRGISILFPYLPFKENVLTIRLTVSFAS